MKIKTDEKIEVVAIPKWERNDFLKVQAELDEIKTRVPYLQNWRTAWFLEKNIIKPAEGMYYVDVYKSTDKKASFVIVDTDSWRINSDLLSKYDSWKYGIEEAKKRELRQLAQMA